MINKTAALIILCITVFHGSRAQLCQGSLGDPVVNINFGAGSNPGQPLMAATTTFTYFAGECPDDGFYTVRNSAFNCFGATWHSVSRDHTGGSDGYFMIINASSGTEPFYRDTIRGLCSNTTFEFAAWLLNLIKPAECGGSSIQPNLSFVITKTDGTLIQTYNTGFIPPDEVAQWKQYGFFFTVPAGVRDIVLGIYNNSRGGCGNDIALDDITFRPCGPTITPSIDGYTRDSIFYCEQTARSFTLRATLSAGYVTPAYQWQQSSDGINWSDINGAVSASYTVNFGATATGTFLYRLAAGEEANFASVRCRIVSSVISITRGAKPLTTMNITSPACEGAPITFTATGGETYTWYREGGGLGVTQANFTIPVADINLAGKIYVKVESSSGCFNIDSSILTIFPKPTATLSFDSTTLCKGDSVQLDATGGTAYSWQPTEGLTNSSIDKPVAKPSVSTDYIITVTGSNGCTDKDTLTVTVIDKITADAGPDRSIIRGDAVQLSNNTAAGIYNWLPAVYLSDAAGREPLAAQGQERQYVLTATSLAGCNTDSDTVNVFVYNDLYIPRAFSPNGNGINDNWNIPALQAFPAFELYVYNRSGRIVYRCRHPFIPWDGYYNGNPADPGNYIYLIKLNDLKKRIYRGNLVLLR